MSDTDLIRQSDLVNRLILDRTTLEELGRVDVLWMYIPAHRVLGLIAKSGFLGNQKAAFNLSQIDKLGAQNLLVNSHPQPTEAEKVRQLESLVNCEVWNNTGEKIGKIIDYRFNLKTGEIKDYLLTTGGLNQLADGIYLLPPHRILSVGHQRIAVSSQVLGSLDRYRDGLKQKFAKVTDELREEYTELTSQAQSLSDRVKEQAVTLSQQVIDQVQEQAQALREQLIEGEELDDLEADCPETAIVDEWDIETLPETPTEVQLPVHRPQARSGVDKKEIEDEITSVAEQPSDSLEKDDDLEKDNSLEKDDGLEKDDDLEKDNGLKKDNGFEKDDDLDNHETDDDPWI